MTSQTRLLLMLPVLGVAAWLALFGDKTPLDGEIAEPVSSLADVAEAVPAERAPGLEESLPPGQIRRMASRAGFLERGERGSDIFSSNEPPAPPPPPPESPSEQPAPPAPFVVFGRILENGRWRVFLDQQGASYVVATGDEVAGFTVDQISSREVRLTRKADKFGFVIPIDGE